MVQKPGSPEAIDVDAQSGGHDAAHQPDQPAHDRRDGGHHARRHDHAATVNGRHGEHAAEPGAAAAAVATEAGGEAPPDRVAELEAALAAAKAEAAENWDKFLRERADMENYKRRLERNQGEQTKRQRKDLLLKTLGVLDNLERAVAYQAESATPVDAKALLTGLQMTYAQFKDFLAGEGLKEVKAVGEQFDPALHEAVSTEVALDKPEGQIVAELQKGYSLGDELLRPARVKVATKA